MKKRKTTIIGFYGGPGIGKSAAAWTAAAWLKRNGASVELANEFVKRWAWQGREVKPLDELYILGEQIREEADLIGKVDFIVTEKPVLLDLAYCRIYQPSCIVRAVEETVAAHYAHVAALGHQHVNVLFRRVGGYNTKGRYESRKQAELVDFVAEQALGELACDGQFSIPPDKDNPYINPFDESIIASYPVYFADRNQIPQFLHSLYNLKSKRPR